MKKNEDQPLNKVLKENKKALKKENKAKKKAARRARGKGFGFYFCIFLSILIVLGGGAAVFSVYFCEVKDVECSGTKIYSDEELKKFILDDEYCTNALYVFFKNLIMPVENVPFIDHFEVTMKTLNTVSIHAVEKKFYGYIPTEKNGYVYYDRDGNVYEVSVVLLGGSMLVEGLNPKKPVIGEPLDVGKTNRRTLLLIQKSLEEQEIGATVITFTEDGTIMLTYGDIMINLGTRANIADKIRRLQYVLPYIEGKRGTLHLEEWSHENTDIVFDEGQ